MNRRAAIPLAAALALCACRDSPHKLTQAEVDSYLAEQGMTHQVNAFHWWINEHPDIPRKIEFPEIATNPVLWDFTLHAVLQGKKRTWTWGYFSYALAWNSTAAGGGGGLSYPTSVIISSGTASTIISSGTCSSSWAPTSQTIVPALSGGYP